MELRESVDGDVLVLSPEGSLVDTDDTRTLDTRLATALKAKTSHIVLDCGAVAHVSSEAIRVLLMTMRKLEHVQGRLVLCGLSARVRNAFKVSGFNRDFTVADSLDEALGRVRQPVERRQVRKPRAPMDTDDAPSTVSPQVDAVHDEPPTPQSAPSAEAPMPVAPVDHDRLAAVVLDGLGVEAGMRQTAAPALADAATLAAVILDALGSGAGSSSGSLTR